MRQKIYLLLVLFLKIAIFSNAQSGITPYSLPDSVSQLFSVEVNGVEVPVKSYKDFEYIHFAMSESASIVITAPDSVGTISSYRIRPEKRGITGTVNNNTLSFSIDKPQQLVVNINFMKKLVILADPPEVDVPSLLDESVVNIMDYEVDATGDSLITTQLQQAIDELPAGGTLYFPAGLYRSGSFSLKGNMTLYLAPGALIKGSDTYTDIKFIDESTNFLYFVRAENANNLSIRGRGAIDGNGKLVRTAYETENGGSKVPGKLILMRNSDCVSIKGVFLRDSYSWNVHAIETDDLHIDRVKVINDFTQSNGDGLDIDGCQGVLVENCFIYSQDDAISPKATWSTVNPTNHVYRNCVLWSHMATGIRLGSETKSDYFSDMLFENIDILHSATMIRLFTLNKASFQDITFRKISVEDYAMYEDTRYDGEPLPRAIKSGETFLIYIYDKSPSAQTKHIHFEDMVSMGRLVKTRFDVPGATTTRIDSIEFVNFIVGSDTLLSKSDASVDTRAGVGEYINFSKSDNIVSANPFEGREILNVTFVADQKKNKIIWEKATGLNIVSYHIYKKNGNNYQLIGSTDVSSPAEFIDSQSSPGAGAETYAITYVNECGDEAEYGPAVNSLFLQAAEGASATETNLSWTKYRNRASDSTPAFYYILKGTSNTELTVIDSVSGSQEPVFVDSNYDGGTVYYQVKIQVPDSETEEQSFSNIIRYADGTTAINDQELPFLVYPNPAHDNINIVAKSSISSVRIYNFTGKMVKAMDISGNTVSMNVSAFASGVYFVDVQLSNQDSYKQKIIIE
ncbi:MAG: glycosyl hydrolase family 28 protein [Draconibacterium sp.]